MPKLYWIDSKGPGRIAISARPRGGDWLADAIVRWRSEGVDAIVSLLTQAEEQDLGLVDESKLSQEQKVRFISLPIEDRDVPRSLREAAEVVHQTSKLVQHGESIAIHCRQGIGRSGMIAAALLVMEGASPEQALQRVSDARGLVVPETAEQREWLKRFAERELGKLDSAVGIPAQ